MTGPTRPRISAGCSRLQLGGVLAVLFVVSYLNGTLTSFHPLIAPIKLAVGLLHFIAIGSACSTLLGLARPRILAVAQDAMLGQLVCLAYVYARSMLCDLIGLPGISSLEGFGAEALLVGLAVFRHRESIKRPAVIGTDATLAIGLHILWLGWLIAIAILKLDLYFTPSSDPDIHAYYAKVFLERGHIYYDLLPNSDAWMVYPSGFGSLNFVLGRLSGLHPVQLVNISAYVQFALFAGATFSVLGEGLRTRAQKVLAPLVYFVFAYAAFNPVFGEQRMYLEGTPRLAHTALLFFPLLFAAQHRNTLVLRPWLWSIPGVGVAVGLCINPAHAPAAVLVCAVSLIAFGRATEGMPGAQRRWLAIAASIALVLTAVVLQDPFYRSLLTQQTSDERVEAATDLTGGALRSDFDLGTLARDSVPAALRALIKPPDDANDRIRARLFLLAALALTAAVTFSRRSQSNRSVSDPSLLFAVSSVAVVVIHGAWNEFVPHIVRPGALQTRLLVQYTDALQLQITLLFFGILLMLLMSMLSNWKRPGNEEERSPPSRSVTFSIIVLIVAGAPTTLIQEANHRVDFYDVLRTSPLGEVTPSDAEFAQLLHTYVPEDQRVLLPGRLRRPRGERWIFTTDAGRSVALFSGVRTSFFLGLDGHAFTANAYSAHVKPSNFDPVWLRAQNTTWMLESGNYPTRILEAHYERVAGTDRVSLWRLRD